MPDSSLSVNPSTTAVRPWPAGSSAYPVQVDIFEEQTAGEFAKYLNDITESLKTLQVTLGVNPAGSDGTVAIALANLHATITNMQGDQGDLAAEIALLASVPGPPNSFYKFTQASPATVWDITHNLGRKPSVTVVDSGGSPVEGEIDYLTDNRLTITFSSGFSGEASLS